MQKKPSFEMKTLKHGIWLTVNREWQLATEMKTRKYGICLTVNRVWQPATKGGLK